MVRLNSNKTLRFRGSNPWQLIKTSRIRNSDNNLRMRQEPKKKNGSNLWTRWTNRSRKMLDLPKLKSKDWENRFGRKVQTSRSKRWWKLRPKQDDWRGLPSRMQKSIKNNSNIRLIKRSMLSELKLKKYPKGSMIVKCRNSWSRKIMNSIRNSSKAPNQFSKDLSFRNSNMKGS